MEYRRGRWWPAWRAVALTVALAAIPLPGLAEETTGRPAAKTPLQASIAKAVASTRLSKSSSQATTDKSQLGSRSFFKTPAGMIVLAVVGAGAGYAVYSAHHDRIHSAVRDSQ